MFRAYVLIVRRSKLYYTASGIITPIGVMIPDRPERRMSSVKLLCNLFWIITLMYSTVGTTQTAFSCHILVRSCFRSVCTYRFSVMVLWKLVTVRNCCIHWVCCFDGFINHNCMRSIVMSSSISCYGPVTVCEFCNTDCASYLLYCVGSLFDILHWIEFFCRAMLASWLWQWV